MDRPLIGPHLGDVCSPSGAALAAEAASWAALCLGGVWLASSGSLTCSWPIASLTSSRPSPPLQRWRSKLQVWDVYDAASRPFMSMTLKIHGATPADLPRNLREQLLAFLEVTPELLEGTIRPGCVHLNLNMRFQNSDDMATAMQSIRHALANSPFAGSAIPMTQSHDVDIQTADGSYTVANGQAECYQDDPDVSILFLDPPVSYDASTVSLMVQGLKSSDSFEVLLRTGGMYHSLEVVEQSAERPDGTRLIIARLPDSPDPGMGWIEVMVDDPSRLIISRPHPMMFTVHVRLAEELNRCLQEKYRKVDMLEGFLSDISDAVYRDWATSPMSAGGAASPELMMEIVSLGLDSTFRLIARSEDQMVAANSLGLGLLTTAVKSGSVQMLSAVLAMKDVFQIELDPCKPAFCDDLGYTALHWAAHAGSVIMLEMLLADVADPYEQWNALTTQLCPKSPSQLLKERHPGVPIGHLSNLRPRIAEDGDVFSDNFSADLMGHRGYFGCQPEALVESLTNSTARAVFPIIYAAMVGFLGWQNVESWCVVLVAVPVLHFLLPFVCLRWSVSPGLEEHEDHFS